MTKLLLSLHVLAAILAIGPVAVAASMYPKALRYAQSTPGDGESLTTLRVLHRICRVYAAIGIAIPVFGIATASSLGVLTDRWLITSILLTAIAAATLALLILPAQDRALAATQVPSFDSGSARQLAMLTGIFNLLWATVTILMIIRPGSTTGA